MRRLTTAALVAVMLVVPAGIAAADDIYIDLITNPGANDVMLDLADGSPQLASVTLEYLPTGMGPTPDDGKAGCNLGGPGSYVTFPVSVQTISGSPASLDKTSVTFPDCNSSVTIGITATAVGVTSVTLGTPTYVTNAGVVTWNSTGAAFSVTVVDSTVTAYLDAPEIANAYLADRADNSDCKAAWGSNKNKSNWHGQLLSHVAQYFQGQSFTSATRHIVEEYIESVC